MDTIKLAIDGSWGIYIPQRFFERYPQFTEHLNSDEDQAIIEQGPEHEHYWDVWTDFLDGFETAPTSDGYRWKLYQDGDVWFVREDHEFEND
jgi:hypothetical protein